MEHFLIYFDLHFKSSKHIRNNSEPQIRCELRNLQSLKLGIFSVHFFKFILFHRYKYDLLEHSSGYRFRLFQSGEIIEIDEFRPDSQCVFYLWTDQNRLQDQQLELVQTPLC